MQQLREVINCNAATEDLQSLPACRCDSGARSLARPLSLSRGGYRGDGGGLVSTAAGQFGSQVCATVMECLSARRTRRIPDAGRGVKPLRLIGWKGEKAGCRADRGPGRLGSAPPSMNLQPGSCLQKAVQKYCSVVCFEMY